MIEQKKIASIILFFFSFSVFAQEGFLNTPREFKTSLMLEPSISRLAILKYDNEVLHGFKTQKQLKTFINRRVYENNTSFIEFEVGSMFDRRDINMFVLNSISQNIKKVLVVFENKPDKEAYVALDYGMGINALEHVVLFSERDFDELTKQLSKFVDSYITTSPKITKMMLQETLISLFSKITHNHVEHRTLNEIWNQLYSIDFPLNSVIKSTKLNSIHKLKTKKLRSFIFIFEDLCRDFLMIDPTHRVVVINGNKFYKIPLQDIDILRFN